MLTNLRHLPLFTVLPFMLCTLSPGQDRTPAGIQVGNHRVRVSNGPGEDASVGSYAIRIYGSNGIDFVTGTIQPRDGEIVRTWVGDLDADGYFEIAVWTRSAGSGSYGKLDIFEFRGRELRHQPLPPIPEVAKKGYRGHDTFEVRKHDIRVRFPIYLPDDANAAPTGGAWILEWRIGKEANWRAHRFPATSSRTP